MTDYRIDALQFVNWSEKSLEKLRVGKLDAVHVTVAYHENFRKTIDSITEWNSLFRKHADRIFQGLTAEDIEKAKQSGRTAIFFGFQNPTPIEDDIGLLEVWHRLGVRFMQLSYNNQSLLATGYKEHDDTGVTNMGREVIKEMNRLGMVIDLSHSGERSTLETIELSGRPVAITHANPEFWHPIKRNKSDKVLKALAESGGILGLSLYPFHLKDGSSCELTDFCSMVARLVDLIGIDHIGIGSDLCQDQPASALHWMRNGRWKFSENTEEDFPAMPSWFPDNSGFNFLADGLNKSGFSGEETAKILGNNWYRYMKHSFLPNER